MTDYYAMRAGWNSVRHSWKSSRGLKRITTASYVLALACLQRLVTIDMAISYDYVPVEGSADVPSPVRHEFEARESTLLDLGFGGPLVAYTPTLGKTPALWTQFRVSPDGSARSTVNVLFDSETNEANYYSTTFTSEASGEGESRWIVTSDTKDSVGDEIPQIDRRVVVGALEALWRQHHERIPPADELVVQNLDAVLESTRRLDQLSIDRMLALGMLIQLDPDQVQALASADDADSGEANPDPNRVVITENATDQEWTLNLSPEALELVRPAEEVGERLRLTRAEADAELQLVDGLLLSGLKFLRGDFPRGLFLAEGPAFARLQEWVGPPGPAAARRAQGTPWRCLWEVPLGISLFLGGVVLPAETWTTLDPAWLARATQIVVGAWLIVLSVLSAAFTHRALILLHATWLFLFGLSVGLRALPWGVLHDISLPGGWILASAVWASAAYRYRTYRKLVP